MVRVLTIADKLEKNSIPEPNSGCFLWIGATNGHGYGVVTHSGKNFSAHREAWKLYHGKDIPLGLMVCHKCDTPACINPTHLFLGTALDNALDCTAKGRNVMQRNPEKSTIRIWRKTHFGSANTFAKLNETQVLQMRQRLAAGESTKAVALAFGVAACTVADIRSRRRWRHI